MVSIHVTVAKMATAWTPIWHLPWRKWFKENKKQRLHGLGILPLRSTCSLSDLQVSNDPTPTKIYPMGIPMQTVVAKDGMSAWTKAFLVCSAELARITPVLYESCEQSRQRNGANETLDHERALTKRSMEKLVSPVAPVSANAHSQIGYYEESLLLNCAV
jgi:hypothetical protein